MSSQYTHTHTRTRVFLVSDLKHVSKPWVASHPTPLQMSREAKGFVSSFGFQLFLWGWLSIWVPPPLLSPSLASALLLMRPGNC